MGIGSKSGKAAGSVLQQANNNLNESAFKAAKMRAMNQRRNLLEQEQAHLICGVSGNPGDGKTGLCLDCRTDEELDTHWIFVLSLLENYTKINVYPSIIVCLLGSTLLAFYYKLKKTFPKKD